MKKTAFLGSAAVFALSAGNALAATHSVMGHGTPHKVISNTPGLVTLYDQVSDEFSGAISSQNFGSPDTLYDDQAADDFVVPPGHKWIIKEVDVPGVNYGTKPASSLNVVFYKDNGDWPQKVAAECDNRSSAGYNGNGGYAIKLKIKTCASKPKLRAGHYWVSVVANQNFSTDSQWFWTLNSTIHNYGAKWQNPSNNGCCGLCDSWCDLSETIGYSADLAFTLKGTDIVG